MAVSAITGAVANASSVEGHIGPFLAPTFSAYYFDASISGPTDSGSSWTNDANAFDGSTATSATYSSGTGALVGYGTTAPSGNTYEITGVRLRVYHGSTNTYRAIAPPSGGWTWVQLDGAGVGFSDSSGTLSITVYDKDSNALTATSIVSYGGTVKRVELEVAYLTGSENTLYMVAEDSSNADQVCVFKSTNGGTSWSKIDQGNQIDLSTNGLSGYAAAHLSFSLAVGATGPKYASGMNTLKDWIVRPFDLVSDTWTGSLTHSGQGVVNGAWGVANTAMAAVTYGADYTHIGQFFFQHNSYTNMGTDYARITRYGFTLFGINLTGQGFPFPDTADDIFPGGVEAEPGGWPQYFHGHYGERTGTDLKAYTHDNTGSGLSGTTSTPVVWKTGHSSGGISNPAVWNDSGTIRILLSSIDGGSFQVRRMVKSAGAITTDLAAASPADASVFGSSSGSVVWDPVNSDAYAFFVYSSDDDLWYDKGANGTSWGTDAEAEDGVTVNDLWVNYYKRNGTEVIGYIINQPGGLYYGELSLASGPQTYNELGRLLDIVSTTTVSDAAVRDELGLTAAAVTTVSVVDGKVVSESLTVNAVATVTSTDSPVKNETGLAVAVVSTVSATDAASRSEQGLSLNAVTTVTETDAAVRAEILSISAVTTITETDSLVLAETGLAFSIVSTTTVTDIPIKDETGLVVAVTSTVTATDVAVRADTLTVPVVSTVTGVDGQVYSDSATINLVTTTTVTDAAVRPEPLTFGIVSTVTGTDVPIKDETGLTFAAVTTLSGSDVAVRADSLTANLVVTVGVTDTFIPGGTLYDETGRAFTITSTTSITDAAVRSDSMTVPLVSTTSGTDAAVRPEVGKTVAVVSTVTGSSAVIRVDSGLVLIVGTLTLADQMVRADSLTVPIVSTITHTAAATLFENLTFGMDILVTETDIYVPSGYTPLPSAGFPGGREGRYDRLGGWPSRHRTPQRVG